MDQPDAPILTAIGIGTAFGVLVLLLALVYIIRLITWGMSRYAGNGADDEDGDSADPEMRARARAAAIAVTALLESRPELDRPLEERDQ